VNDTKCTMVWHVDDLKTPTSGTWEVPQSWVWIFRQAKQANAGSMHHLLRTQICKIKLVASYQLDMDLCI